MLFRLVTRIYLKLAARLGNPSWKKTKLEALPEDLRRTWNLGGEMNSSMFSVERAPNFEPKETARRET